MKVAIVAGPDPGHAFPALALACALRDRGHDPMFVSGEPHRTHATGEGLRFQSLRALAPTPHDGDMGHRLWVRPIEMGPLLAEDLRTWRPDLVVADVLTRAGAFAAELLGLPWIELSPHHLMDPDPAVPPVGLGRPPARTPWRRWDDDRIRRLQTASVAAGREQERLARASLGLPRDGGAPLGRMLATVPSLEFPRDRWPADAHVVGPLPWDPPWPALEPPVGAAPLVVVTDSTASSTHRSLAEVALAGLRHADVRVVVTTGRRDLAGGTSAVVGRAPHGPLLRRAAVAVSTGGHGFVGKALAAGVPLVVSPTMGDQRETAGRLRQAGAGVRLPPWSTRPTTLRLAVQRVLTDPTFTAAARRVADEAAALGPSFAAALVERLAARA